MSIRFRTRRGRRADRRSPSSASSPSRLPSEVGSAARPRAAAHQVWTGLSS